MQMGLKQSQHSCFIQPQLLTGQTTLTLRPTLITAKAVSVCLFLLFVHMAGGHSEHSIVCNATFSLKVFLAKANLTLMVLFPTLVIKMFDKISGF